MTQGFASAVSRAHALAVMSSHESEDWATPPDLYAALHEEFGFTLDPCPLGGVRHELGLLRSWAGERVYCNPPYGREIVKWLEKADEAEIAVYLLPARTDTRWWHGYALRASEIRFIKGRLRWPGSRNPAPFPSVVLVYRGPR